MRGRQEETPIPVLVRDVFDACAGFGECYISVLDCGRGALGMERFELGGCEEGLAVVGFELVGDAEFFAEPEDALGG